MQTDAFHVFDTTLRDGAQREGITYSVADKLAVARLLDVAPVTEFAAGVVDRPWDGVVTPVPADHWKVTLEVVMVEPGAGLSMAAPAPV